MKKKFAFLLGFTLLGAAGFSQSAEPVLMTINGEEITKSEFEYVYNKNNSNASVEKKSVDEYIDLFVNFKLKVAEAKAHGVDKTQSFQKEFSTYMEQLAAPYLVKENEDVEFELIKEAYIRSRESINVSHILIGKNSEPSKLDDVLQRLNAGESFESVAKRFSECPSSSNGGNLGYINVFDMVYPFECAAYSTPVGSYSKPIRSKYGHHILLVHDRRPNIIKTKISQIYLPISVPNSLIKRDSLFNLIKNGADFDTLAKSHSSSYSEKTGCTSIISKGVFPKDFENQIFKIKKGEIEKLNSPMGYYIVRCEDNSLNMELDSTTKEEIKNKISKNDRADNISLQLVERYKNKYGFEFYPNALNLFVDAMTQTKQHIDVLLMKQNDPLFMLGGETFSQEDFKTVFSNNLWKFSIIKNGQSERAMAPELDVNSSEKDFVYFIFNNYVKSCIMDREYDWLYKNNPEYRNLLNEYKDGLLLFDISQREVWGKSARDAVKLTEFFEANKEKYSFSEPKFRGSIIYCKNEKIKKKAEKLLAKGMSAEDVVKELKEDFKKEEKPAYLKVGLFAKGNNEAVDANIFKSAEYKNEKYPFVVLTGSLTNTPENYREVKGPVTADYQNQLEIEWVKSLREKYPVVINQDVLDSIKNK